jgi:predicted patatin/cPLA2 family phospholipase
MRITKAFYRKYPALQKALAERNTVYNKTMDLLEKLEEEGKITVIRPLKSVEVGRMETDTTKLKALYQERYERASSVLNQMSDQLSK